MGLAVQRDLDAVVEGITAWLDASRGGRHEVDRASRPSDGLSSETIMVDVRSTEDDSRESLVVRLPPTGDGAFEHYDLAVQVEVQQVAAEHGVPVATPAVLVPETSWLGAPFMVMPLVDGHVGGQVSVRDPWIAESSTDLQRRVYVNFIDVLAAIHRIAPDAVSDVVPARGIDGELAHWARYLEWYADGERVVPALDDALAWCSDRRPDRDPPASLLWGDVRLGNVIFGEAREALAVLDWEMSTVGAAEHDVAWWRALEAIQDELFGTRVPGFPSPEDARARYESHLGRPLEELPWFEVFALVRSVAVMTRIAILHERAGRPPIFPVADNPVLGIIQRRIDAFAPP
jgi:aminoglycoside phosphotransferase (APT) family kinase protein